MIRKYLLPLLAIVGALLGLSISIVTQKKAHVQPIMFPPPKSPFVHSIAGAGIIEASSDNISIGSPFNEIVEEVAVVEGDKVKKGDILFKLDLRFFYSVLLNAKATLEQAEMTRNDKAIQFSFYQRLQNGKAVSEQLFEQTFYAFLEAQEGVKVAESGVREAEVNIERSTIRAPLDGKILQVNIHIGENATSPLITQIGTEPLIVMGRVDPLQVRVQIDEDDCWRFREGAKAQAFVRGNRAISFPLQYTRVVPYVIPKSSFTGEIRERVDTRVLEVLYVFEKKELPVYVGQMIDVYIETESL